MCDTTHSYAACARNSYTYTLIHFDVHTVTYSFIHMGWLRLVGPFKFLGLFCSIGFFYRALLKKTYNFKEPTNRSHHISISWRNHSCTHLHTCWYPRCPYRDVFIHSYIYLHTCWCPHANVRHDSFIWSVRRRTKLLGEQSVEILTHEVCEVCHTSCVIFFSFQHFMWMRLYESWVIYKNLNICDRWFHLIGPRKFDVIFLGPNLKSAVTYVQILIHYSTFVQTNVS